MAIKPTTEPIKKDAMTPEQIKARMAEIEAHADEPCKSLDDGYNLLAEYMELEDELERLTDPERKQTRH